MTSNKNKNKIVTETFHGYIETTRDALLLFEACKRGIVPRTSRRLQDKERHLIRSGSIFCFDEHESGIKRWTDGLVWSPSRILGNFLIYRELHDKKLTRSNSADYGMMHGGATNLDERNSSEMLRSRSLDSSISPYGYSVAHDHLRRQREKALLGSLKNSYKFKRNGLIKKSMSLVVDGVQQHIISYYTKEDVLSNKLKTPSSMTELSSLEVSAGLSLRQNFRMPLFMSEEITTDGAMNNKKSYPNDLNIPQYNMGISTSSFTPSVSSNSSNSSINNYPTEFTNNQLLPPNYNNYPVNPYNFCNLNPDILILFSDTF